MSLFLGIDVGTSGVRMAVIDAIGNEITSATSKMPPPIEVDKRPCQDPNIWWVSICGCLANVIKSLPEKGYSPHDIQALAVDGTSGTTLLASADLRPLTLGYMYNSSNFHDEAKTISANAPANSIVQGASSGLARLLFLQRECDTNRAAFAMHQADWVAAKFMKRGGYSDETNVLKMGYDVHNRRWPEWMEACGVRTHLLPQVKPVGDTFSCIHEVLADQFGLNPQLRVVAGATDSNAAFLASGACRVGEGVTSLGTTIAIKLLSDTPVSDPNRGIYSHRIKDMWLPGGASNSGGGVLLEHFSAEQMQKLEANINPTIPTGLDYYPLSRPGERFPISDPNLQPRLVPRPNDDAQFFQGMLEGMSEIERIGYAALEELGAAKLTRVFTAGGGARNAKWSMIRREKLGVPIERSQSSHASVGTARIAAGLI